jgi:tetratricopeptide (TPR) repeat protein
MPLLITVCALSFSLVSAAAAAQEPRDPIGLGSGPVPDTVRVPPTPSREAIEKAVRARNWEQAENLLVADIQKRPDSPELLTFLAGIFMADRKPLNAAIAFKKAEALAPLNDSSRYALAIAYIAMGRGDWARPELERLEKSDPADTTYQYWLARLDYDDGFYGSAIERLNQVIEAQPDFVRAHDNLGLNYEAQDDPDSAVLHYREAIRLNRQAAFKSPWPPLNLGILLRSRGELKEAERLFRESIEYDDTFAQAHYQLGALLEQMERPDAAIKELKRAAALDEAYPQPHYALARIYRRQGREDDAREAMTTFKRLFDAQQQAPR